MVGVLDEVRARPEPEKPSYQPLLGEDGDYYDLRRGREGEHTPQCPVRPHDGRLDVEYHHVGLLRLRQRDGLHAVGGLPDHRHVVGRGVRALTLTDNPWMGRLRHD